MKKAITAHKNLHTNQQNEQTPGLKMWTSIGADPGILTPILHFLTFCLGNSMESKKIMSLGSCARHDILKC